MLLTKNLIENVDEKYIPMLKEVNIPEFTKCIAEFSGLQITQVSDSQIKDYLLTWARNKYRFYKLLGNSLKADREIEYKKMRNDIEAEVSELGKEFPLYYPWLKSFKRHTSNKIDTSDLNWDTRDLISELFPQFKADGSTITHFFKKLLGAPDDLITRIASIFENDEVKANHTISIDPVDMMLASENPYNWQSCYRLDSDNSSSHADGCMAAVLDDVSLITYVWTNEGKMNIYGRWDFKNVRYKIMREWICISHNMTTVHFNDIYPGKNYEDEFYKLMRTVVEEKISEYLGLRNMWRKVDNANIDRKYYYGYSEFSRYQMWVQSDSKEEYITVYNEEILCACGCATVIDGSDEGKEYLGEGFKHNCYEDSYYCEYADDYCSHECDEYECEGCCHWENYHPVCHIDTTEPCEEVEYACGGVAEYNCHCEECPIYQREHEPDEDEED